MNIKRVNKIISEILKVENSFGLQGKISNIVSYFQNNNSEALNEAKLYISDSLSESIISTYVNSDLKILKELELIGYFDMSLENEIDEILSSQSHEILTKITALRDKRAQLLVKITALKKSFDDLGVEVFSVNEEEYHIIFALPQKYHNLENLSRATKDINQFLNALNQTLKDSKYEIKSVDNGCIEFLISAIPELASRFVDVLETILTIKEAIDLVVESKDKIEKIAKKNKKSINEQIDAELEDRKLEYIEALLKRISSSDKTNKLNSEQETSIRVLLKKMITYFEEGVYAEVKTPYMEKPDDYDGDDKSKIKELERKLDLYQQKEKIDDINKKIFLAQKEGLSLMLPGFNDENK